MKQRSKVNNFWTPRAQKGKLKKLN